MRRERDGWDHDKIFFLENFVCHLMCGWLNVYQISKIMPFDVHKRDYYSHSEITLYEASPTSHRTAYTMRNLGQPSYTQAMYIAKMYMHTKSLYQNNVGRIIV